MENIIAGDSCSTKVKLPVVFDGVKTLWKKEKMLVTSIFSFSNNDTEGLFP